MGDVAIDHPAVDAADRVLRLAAGAFALAVLVHNADHLRRGADSVSAQVFWLGSAAIVLEVGIVALVAARDRSAPLGAIAVGFSLAAGYLVVHFTPGRSFASDSLVDGGAQAASLVAASLETLTALALGLAGVHAVRERGMAATAGGAPMASIARGLRQPPVAAFALANAVLFVLSVAGR